jgi:Resolvase, N terminal domain
MPRRGHFDVVAVWACDRLARSTRHFLEVLDELNHLNLEFRSFGKVEKLSAKTQTEKHSSKGSESLIPNSAPKNPPRLSSNQAFTCFPHRW